MMDEFVALFKKHIMPTSKKYNVTIHAGWKVRPQSHPCPTTAARPPAARSLCGGRVMQSQENEFVWMRSYDKPETLETYEACPERAEYSPLVGKCIVKTELRVGIEELVANESPVRATSPQTPARMTPACAYRSRRAVGWPQLGVAKL